MKASFMLLLASRALVPMQIAFSIFLLMRGHNDPGGGFAGGLVVAAALGLVAIASSPQEARRLLRIDPIRLASIGLLVAVLSGFIGPLSGNEFLTGEWIDLELLGFHLALGSPLLFDIGVYLLVVGIATAILLGLMGAEGDDAWNL